MLSTDPSAWHLPSARRFLSEAVAAGWQGGAVLSLDPSTPPGFVRELAFHLREDWTVQSARPVADEMPLHTLSRLAGCKDDLSSLAAAEGQALIVDASGCAAAEIDAWRIFLARLADARSDCGPAIFFLAPSGFQADGMNRLDWPGLRRIDSMIWAEHHVPENRARLVQELAVNLAVELCGWRQDLVADLVTQREEDLLNPLGWIGRNTDRACDFEAAYGGRRFSCPLQLFVTGDMKELTRRIWRAQLSSLFPWIEEQRLQIIDRNRKFLRIDEHLRALRVQQVQDIELGALRYQLRPSVARDEFDHVEALAAMRNALAHRQPISPPDFERVHNAGRGLGR